VLFSKTISSHLILAIIYVIKRTSIHQHACLGFYFEQISSEACPKYSAQARQAENFSIVSINSSKSILYRQNTVKN